MKKCNQPKVLQYSNKVMEWIIIIHIRSKANQQKAKSEANLPHSVHEIPSGHHIAIAKLPIATIAGILVKEIMGTYMLF